MSELPGYPRGREAAARAAIAAQPGGAARLLTPDRLLAAVNDHVFEDGWHIGWVWGSDGGRGFLDVISEHRMTDAGVTRFWLDGDIERLSAPGGMRSASEDPDEDAKLEREYIERQRAIVDDLRARGLLPAVGESLPSLDINEALRTARLED